MQCCGVLQVHAPVRAVHAQVLADAEGCPPKILGEQAVTKETLEDVTKEILEEKKRGATLILPQPLFGSGCGKL